MNYIIVPARERKGAKTRSMLILNEQGKAVKTIPFPADDPEARIDAYLKADEYVDQVLRRDQS